MNVGHMILSSFHGNVLLNLILSCVIVLCLCIGSAYAYKAQKISLAAGVGIVIAALLLVVLLWDNTKSNKNDYIVLLVIGLFYLLEICVYCIYSYTRGKETGTKSVAIILFAFVVTAIFGLFYLAGTYAKRESDSKHNDYYKKNKEFFK